jgi:hypothetical protein
VSIFSQRGSCLPPAFNKESLHIGMPPEKIPGLETKTIYVHNFLDLCDVRSNHNFVESPSFYCFGHEWKVQVFPGGNNITPYPGWVLVVLRNCSSRNISIDWAATTEKDGCPHHSDWQKGLKN